MINIQSSIPIIGIYKITSPSGKIYIGQSVNIDRRWIHYGNIDCKQQPHIFNSLKKYGPENHTFDKIEECSEDMLLKREIYWKQYYIDKHGWDKMLFCSLYDKGFGPRDEKIKLKISQSLLKYWDINSHPSLGKPCLHKEKLKGISRNKGNTARRKIVLQIDINTNDIIKEWPSRRSIINNGMRDIANAINKNKIYLGYIWKYK
jgi:group I intron endonuclease